MCEPEGWIKIHRKILKWEWYDDAIVFKLFMHCLFKANFEEKQWHGTAIPKGSFITSIANLAGETFLTIKQVRNALNKLIKTKEITTKGTNKYTMLTINNYDTYQIKGEAKGRTKGEQRANGGQTEGKQRATTKEYKELEELQELENNIISSEPLQVSEQVIINFPTNRFNTINEEFAVTENYFNEMKNCYPAVDVISELNKMRAWLISNSEKRKTKQGMTKFINSWLSKRQDQGIKNEYNQKNIGNTAGSEYRTLPGGRVAANFTAEDYQSTWDG